MSKDNLDRGRRSTRLSISIPIVISGVDALGQEFSESVRTLVVNKHGGKILTTRHLAMGTEVLIENRAVGAVAKAGVAWLSEKHSAGDLHHVGLQLLEAQNVWGIAFPPEDWSGEPVEEQRAGPGSPPAVERPAAAGAGPGSLRWPVKRSPFGHCRSCRSPLTPTSGNFRTGWPSLVNAWVWNWNLTCAGAPAGAKKGEMGALEEEIKVSERKLETPQEKRWESSKPGSRN